MDNTLQSTEYVLPLAYVDNGLIAAPWTNPQYLLLQDDLTAESNSSQGAAADVILSNFNLNIPVGAVITGIQFKVRGYVGAVTVPPASLSFSAVNNLSGENEYYPFTAPFTGFSQDLVEYVFGGDNYLFDREWTVDEINNFKIQLLGAGNVFVDDVQVKVFFYVPGTPTPPDPNPDVCETCESQIQGVEYFLALQLNANDTKAYVYNFKYADGTNIQMTDLGECGGSINIVLDEGKIAGNGQNFMENAKITAITILEDGLVELDFGNINNRGLMFREPYGHDVNLLSAHAVNAKLIISNNGPFYDLFLKKCQIGVLVSAPIEVLDEGDEVVPVTTKFNFIGDNVQAEQDETDPEQANITVLSDPENVSPDIEDENSSTTGTGTASSLTYALTIVDANYLRVWVSADDEVISSVTYDGVAMTLIADQSNGPADIKVALYGLILPNAGTNDIVVTMASPSHITSGAISFTDVDTSNPVDGVSSGAIGSSTAPSDSVTTTVQNTVLMDVVGTKVNTTAFLQTSPWTIRLQENAASRPGASSTRKVLVPASVTDTYAISPTGAWAILIAGVRGQASPASSDEKVKVSGADDTPGFLQPKLNVHSSDGSVTVTETITNPGANEILDIDVTSSGAGALPFDINQTGHGFSVGDIIRPTTSQWAASQSDTSTHAEAWAQVTVVTDADNFTALPLQGTRQIDADIVALIAGFTGGDVMYVDETTPGALTDTPPSTTGTVSKPVGYVEADDMGDPIAFLTVNYRGQENQATPAGFASYTVNADPGVTDWMTLQLDAPNNDSGTPWTVLTSGITFSEYINGRAMYQTGGINADATGFTATLPSLKTGAQLTFSSTTYLSLKFSAIAYPGLGTTSNDRFGFIGFTPGSNSSTPPDNFGDILDYLAHRIGFAFYDGNIYACAFDGNPNGATVSVLPYSSTAIHEYQIVINGTTSAEFYIDGVLVATITTFLPTSGNAKIQFQGLVGLSQVSSGFLFISKMVFSEKII